MNILANVISLRVEQVIKEAYKVKNIPKSYSDYKKQINLELGIFFINFIATKESNIFNVMIKRKNITFIYSYNTTTDMLSLKGERRNVNNEKNDGALRGSQM